MKEQNAWVAVAVVVIVAIVAIVAVYVGYNMNVKPSYAPPASSGGSGGNVAITGTIVEVEVINSGGGVFKIVHLDLNGDGVVDKKVAIDVDNKFYYESYPIKSKVRFTNLLLDNVGTYPIKGQHYDITANSDKEHIGV
ncbi:MAG: hypothetical protein AABX95_03190 [Nanoarchaeota archaeon]